jgi:hypothetical protein
MPEDGAEQAAGEGGLAVAEIYKAMAAIMADVEALGKVKRNQQQGFNYRGVDDVYNALHPILSKHNVFMTPEVLAQEREERTTAKGGTLLYSRVTLRYTFWTVDGSSVSCSVIGEGTDSGDKATNKAMSIAHKYALFQCFAIPTEEMPDPDAESHKVAPKFVDIAALKAEVAKLPAHELEPRWHKLGISRGHPNYDMAATIFQARKHELDEAAKEAAA